MGNEITDIESCLMASCGIKVFKKSGGWVKHNSLITDLPSLVFNYTDTDSVPTGNPSNLYYSALRFRDKIKELMVLNGSSCYYDSTKHEPIITADCDLGPQINGEILYGTPGTSSQIKISTGNGRYSSTLCHEMTHDMVNRSLIFNSFRYGSTSELRGAMDDAFSSYFPCMYRNNPYYRSSLYTKDLSDPALTVASVHSSEYPTSTVNEDIYARYDMRFPLASAWWDLRNRTHFPDLNDNGFNAVDTLLVGALGIVKEDLPLNAEYRYKPRYFYNILMKRVDDDTTPYPLNPKQVAIQKAYTSRGVHFYPRVQSYSLAQKPRNSFSPGNQVHVNITEAPQNTPFKVYVIRHGEYSYVNGASVSTLNNHLASDFTPIEESTDADGRWSGLIWTIPTITENAIGEYDIIVDFGSPEQPDGRIHFAFNAADVMDGFDGLNGPGFTVYDDSIDIVLALDCSASMSTHITHLARTGRQFVAQLSDGDRVGVFAFAAVYDPNTLILNDVLRKMIPTNDYGLVEIENNKEALCDGQKIFFPEGIDYSTYWANMITPYEHGFQSFDDEAKPKHFITISDGWNCLPPNFLPPDAYDPTNDIHNLIIGNYADIHCHSMRYKVVGTNPYGPYPYNEAKATTLMNNVATWGDGTSWSKDDMLSIFWDINAILDMIKGRSSTVDQRGSFTATGNTVNIPFTVDKNAHFLSANLSIDWFCHTDMSCMDFSLISPSGIDYSQNPDYYSFYTSNGRVEVPFPEEGTWEVIIERPSTSTYVNSYSFSAQVKSDLEVLVSELPSSYQLNMPLLLSVDVKDYLSPVSDAAVMVRLLRDGWSHELSLFDDGYHNDGLANDGIYSNYLYAYPDAIQAFPDNICGMYDLLFEVSVPSLNAQRVKRYQIEMSAPEQFPYSVTGRSLHKGWNWVGYPRLQRDELGESVEYANLSLVPYLHDILYYEDSAQYSNNNWTYYGLESLKSPAGYKLRINSTEDVKLFELGTIVDTLMVHPLCRDQWHWYTYPCYERAVPREALLGAINSIDYIMAEKWSMKKENGEWIFGGFGRPYLKYGDSIMIRATRNGSFVWNNPLTIPQIVEPQKPIHFTFEDKPDYETLMIESIEGNQDFSEIGVFQDDECIGARVIQAYPIQILAYSTPPEEGGGNLSFCYILKTKQSLQLFPAPMCTRSILILPIVSHRSIMDFAALS